MIKQERSFNGQIERYHFDHKLSVKKGWAQIDTAEDAFYFGNWANPSTNEIVSFMEGDIVKTKCDTTEEFIQEINGLNKCYGSIRIDCGFNKNDTYKLFESIGLGNLLH